jgi:ketosteroid isomerase-like protein
MKKVLAAAFLTFAVAAALSSVAFSQASNTGDAKTIATITKIENDAVMADLTGDVAFYEKILADDWSGGTSRGTWDSKASALADMKDTKNNKTNSESISDLQVRTHGDIAIATYQTIYDSLIHGTRFARTIISTDIFQRQGGAWKQIANHSSLVHDQPAVAAAQ